MTPSERKKLEFFQDNESLIDWINSQKLTNPLYCLGDGHSGIWNIMAENGTWVARYQVRQGQKVYWYYKLQASIPLFQQKNAKSLSKYRHLGKAGSSSHVDAVMGVLRRTIVCELQKTIDAFKECLVDIAFDAEQESK